MHLSIRAVLFAVVGTATQLPTPSPTYRYVHDAYGILPKYDGPIAKTLQFNRAFDQAFKSLRMPENCIFPLEVLIVQDSTASFLDNFLQMKNTQLPLMMSQLVTKHPGSKVGVESFRDKPIFPYGDPAAGDYCQRFEAPLTDNLQALQDVYGRMISIGGMDPPETSFSAIVAGSASSTPGWANPLATRIVVLSTDAPPHFADDGDNAKNLPPFSGFNEATMDMQCLNEYYPNPKQVKDALKARNAYGVFLVFDPDYQNGLVGRSWDWFNTYLEQSAEFINPLANDASDFWNKLEIAIKKIESLECTPIDTTPPPTTTMPPATMPPTTLPPATMPPTTLPPATMPPTTIPPATTLTATGSPVGPTETTVPTAPPAPTTIPPPATTMPPMTPPMTATATDIPPTATMPMTTPPMSVSMTDVPPTMTPPTVCSCPPCAGSPCDPCACPEGVLIKLRYRPQKLKLEVLNDVAAEADGSAGAETRGIIFGPNEKGIIFGKGIDRGTGA